MRPTHRSIHASAPTRIDLAGGTLDIWPLNLLVERAVTVNVAIDRRAHVTVSASAESQHRIRAEDIDREVVVPVVPEPAATGGTRQTELPLHEAALRHTAPTMPLRIVTRSDVPAGSGLGGSSALAVCLLAALRAQTGAGADAALLAPLARDIEAGVLQVPTGTQDHLAALHGGMAAIEYGPGLARREALPTDTAAFEARGVLVYLGASRASATSNWDMVRRALDKDAATRRGLTAIAAIACAMRDTLARGDLEGVARLLDAEWQERRGLSPQVSTPDAERAIATAKKAGAVGGKICGAGGGGCLFVMGPADARDRVAADLEQAGFAMLDFHVDARGLLVGVEDDGVA